MGHADLILTNGIIRSGQRFSKIVNSVAIGSGKIVELGNADEVLQLRKHDTEVIDLKRRVVIPGLHDTHVHALMTALWLRSAGIEKAHSVSKICKIVADCARRRRSGEWIHLVGCVPWMLQEKRLPYRWELDEAAPNNPVYIATNTLHSGCLNSAAWELCSLDSQHRDIDRNQETGKPTGVLLGDECFFHASRESLAALKKDDLRKMFIEVTNYAATKGVTTLHCLDGQWVKNDADVETHISVQKELPINTVIMWQTFNVNNVLNAGLPRVGGCLAIDGATFERTAWFYEPYIGTRTCGEQYIDDKNVYDFVYKAHCAGLQVSMHAIGDRAIDLLVRAIGQAQRKWPRKNCRHRIEHFQCPSAWAIDQAVDLQLVLAMQPSFSWIWGVGRCSEYELLLGRERAERLHPFGNIIARKGHVVGGSDSPVTPIDPLLGIHALVNMPNEARRVAPEEALAVFSSNAAWAAHSENECGTLEVGKMGDMIVLGEDLLTRTSCIDEIEIEMVISRGKVVVGD